MIMKSNITRLNYRKSIKHVSLSSVRNTMVSLAIYLKLRLILRCSLRRKISAYTRTRFYHYRREYI